MNGMAELCLQLTRVNAFFVGCAWLDRPGGEFELGEGPLLAGVLCPALGCSQMLSQSLIPKCQTLKETARVFVNLRASLG